MTRARKTQQRKLAAILMADVAGYSLLVARDEPGTLDEFRRHMDTYVRRAINRFHGRLFKTAGDGLLVEFGSPVHAVECALAFQRGAAKRNKDLLPDRQMQFRIGVNFADVVVDEDDLLGDGVNVASRLQALAHPGGIVVSQAVVQHVKGKIRGTGFEDLGEHRLKNIPDPVHIYGVGPSHEAHAVPAPEHGRLGIAVLPFVNMSGDDDQRYFSDGITEDIITELSRFRTLSVIARNSSFAYRDKAVDVKRIAEELHVHFIVEGSIRKLDNRVRITVQLINAEARRHVWAERYDVELSELFAVQDDVTRRVVGTLVPRIETEELDLARKRPTADARAYDCYLRGKSIYYAATDAAARAEARAHFERAILLDEGFARAYVYLAAIENNRAVYSPGDPGLAEARTHARNYAEKAVSLDDSDPLTHLSLAWCHLWHREFAAARAHLEIATRLNPNDADRAMDRGTTLMYLGEPDAALEVMQAAMRLNPFHPDSYLLDLAEALFVARRYDDMLKTAEKIADPSPKFTAWKAAAYAYAGRNEEARRHAALFIGKMRDIWIGAPDVGPQLLVDWVVTACPFRRQQDSDHLLNGLRMAGLPV